jgi:hypothetical protein
MNTCLINQSACGREPGNPVCPKCGMDERVVFPSQFDLAVALNASELEYWKAHARELQHFLEMEDKASDYWKTMATELQNHLEMEERAVQYWKSLAIELQRTKGEAEHHQLIRRTK